MTEHDKIVNYLNENRHLLSLSGIAKEVGISASQLHHALNGDLDGRGYKIVVPEKHLAALKACLLKLKFK
jgi:hypothetical protein